MGFDRLHPNETSYKAKLVARTIALILASAGIVAAGYSWRLSIFVLPILIISWLWCFINIIKRISSAYPVHPGANIAFDFMIHLLFIILGGVNLIVAIFANVVTKDNWNSNAMFKNRWGNAETCTKTTTTNEDDDTTTTKNDCTIPADTIDLVRKLAKASLAACAFAMMLCLLHFIFFIWACVDAHRRRRERRDAIAAFQAKQNEFSTEPHDEQEHHSKEVAPKSTSQNEREPRNIWPVFA